jgi:hypothetical protein
MAINEFAYRSLLFAKPRQATERRAAAEAERKEVSVTDDDPVTLAEACAIVFRGRITPAHATG